MCTWRSSMVRGAIVALVYAAVAFAQPTDPLPAVAIRFELISDQYRTRMGASFDETGRIVSDSIRKILQSRFPFVRWDGRNATDTVLLRVAPAPDDPQKLNLNVTLTGPTAPPGEPYSTMLEARKNFTARREWVPTVVARDWVRAIHDILDRESPRLVQRILGRLRIAVPVDIDGTELTAVVHVDADSLRASNDAMPKFRVVVELFDPRSRRTPPGPAQLILGGCLRDQGSYSCEIEVLIYREKSRAANEDSELIGRAELRSPVVYILEYRPRAASAGRAVVAAAARK